MPVKRADEINQIFDAISYSKGSCVLRMISTYLGEDVFLEGVRQYLKKHAYGNTQTGDLWASLSAASGKPLEDIMHAWTKKVGYPVLTVTENEKEGSVHVKQNRFLRTGDTKPEEDEVLYPVFLSMRTKEGVDKSLALNEREKDLKLPDGDFFKLNANHTGIYRTSYTPARLEKLGKAAKDGLLTVEDRAGMIADAGALATSGYQKTSGVLSLLKGFDSETEFVVWNEIIGRLAGIQSAWLFEDKAIRDGLEAFLRDLVSPKAHKMGWQFSDSDGHVEQQFKAMMFEVAGLSGDKAIIAAAKDMFSKFMSGDRAALHPNIRKSVFAIALKFGGEEEVRLLSLLSAISQATCADHLILRTVQQDLGSTTVPPQTATSATAPSAAWVVPRTKLWSTAPWPYFSEARSRTRTCTCPSAASAATPPASRPCSTG